MGTKRNEHGQRVGESHPAARLTDAQVRALLLWRAEGMTYRTILARLQGEGATVTMSTIRAISTGRRRVAVAVRIAP